MEVLWTDEQKEVINTRDCNLLVSAAAGSGKTAVLVERIIQMITEDEKPLDIDQLLVVTFTNAAAAEMKERIGNAIEKKLEENPNHIHLQKQISLIHKAQVSTIHSFCLFVIRNYFHVINIDPSFKIADDGDLVLMQADIIEDLLEKKYASGDENFINFVNAYGNKVSDKNIEKMIKSLYAFAQSYPNPVKWLEEQKENFCIDNIDDMFVEAHKNVNTEEGECHITIKVIIGYINTIIKEMQAYLEKALEICKSENGPDMYVDAIMADIEILDELKLCKKYSDYYILLNHLQYKRLSTKKGNEIDDLKKEQVKELRQKFKDHAGNLLKDYFFNTIEQVHEDSKSIQVYMNTFINMVIDYYHSYTQAKREANFVDFHDLEHFALEILTREVDGEYIPTDVAKELQNQFQHIIIDEYQDSNLVQEAILTSVSRIHKGTPNIFMVGDVKQSIYKFRLARPEIFMDKYYFYTRGSGLYRKIDLYKNFRSRKEVLQSINYIFEQIMQHDVGGITYDENQALYVGAQYPDTNQNYTTELMFIDLNSEKLEGNLKEEEYVQDELEAKAIARRIRELTDKENGFQIYDGKNNCTRCAEYRDIVILTRNKRLAGDFVEVLNNSGIPAHTESSTGYFNTVEIKTILSMLQIIDNPYQDIELTAILRSPIVNLTAEEIAIIHHGKNHDTMFDKVIDYEFAGEDKKIKSKLSDFLTMFNEFRNSVSYVSIHELLHSIYTKTGYYHYASAMPFGDKREANLNILVEKAVAYETTKYKGLFNFNRYIKKLKKYEMDFEEANIFSENDNTVRIMTIHKSKGLEFPIVFVSGMGKQFNKQDTQNKMLIHSDLGIGADYIDVVNRIKSSTIMKKAVQNQIKLDNLGEELRVLYVALTRAKEKLIMTGIIKSYEKKIAAWGIERIFHEIGISYLNRISAETFLDFIMPAVMKHKVFDGIIGKETDYTSQYDARYELHILGIHDIVEEEVMSQVQQILTKEKVLEFIKNNKNNILCNKIHQYMNYIYPYEEDITLRSKLTVSELKASAHLDDETKKVFGLENISEEIVDKDDYVKEQTEILSIKPNFVLSEEEKVVGIHKGNIYHKVLQGIDFRKMTTLKDIREQIGQMVLQSKITHEEATSVYLKAFQSLALSNIGKRMIHAEKQSKLYRERQFVIGVHAKDIKENCKSDEIVILQGIIDVYFEEDNEIVLLDYKTDFVPKNIPVEEFFKERYKVQIDLYERAIEQITGKKIKERLIYSFGIHDVVNI